MKKTKQLKIKIAVALCMFLAFMFAFTPFMQYTSAAANQMQEQVYYLNNRQSCMETIIEQFDNNATALTTTQTVYLNNPAPFRGRLYDEEEVNIYSSDGVRQFALTDSGMMVGRRGNSIYVTTYDSDTTANREGSFTLSHVYETDEFLDGADRKLAIFLNSRLERHELRRGGTYTRAIRLTDKIHLVSYHTGNYCDNYNPILNQIFISKYYYRTGWGIFHTNRVRIYDMNGRVVCDSRLRLPMPRTWWLPRWSRRLVDDLTVNVIEILDSFTLGDLMTLLATARHPWPQIIDPNTGHTLITEDGRDIRVHPRTWQLTDFWGFGLFNSINGLPIVFNMYTMDIVTTNLAQQRIENGVLLEAMTVQQMLNAGTPFHMHIVPTPFGDFDVPVFNNGTAQEPDWRLMNGESTDGVTMRHEDSAVLNTHSPGLSGWLGGLFGGDSIFSRIFRVVAIVFGILFGLIIVAFIAKVVIMVISLFKKSNKGGNN